MGRRYVSVVILLGLSMLAGCATSYHEGRAALRQGRYDEAAGHFERVLQENPARADALLGLGISRYKLGAFDEAVATLDRVVTLAVDEPVARLYLALSYVQKGDAFGAEDQLAVLRGLRLDGRLATQIDRALDVIRLEPLTPPIRAFLAASLEGQAELLRELREVRLEAQRLRHQAVRPPRICVKRRGVLLCY